MGGDQGWLASRRWAHGRAALALVQYCCRTKQLLPPLHPAPPPHACPFPPHLVLPLRPHGYHHAPPWVQLTHQDVGQGGGGCGGAEAGGPGWGAAPGRRRRAGRPCTLFDECEPTHFYAAGPSLATLCQPAGPPVPHLPPREWRQSPPHAPAHHPARCRHAAAEGTTVGWVGGWVGGWVSGGPERWLHGQGGWIHAEGKDASAGMMPATRSRRSAPPCHPPTCTAPPSSSSGWSRRTLDTDCVGRA